LDSLDLSWQAEFGIAMLAIGAVIVGLAIAVVVFGFVLALRAARGSPGAMGQWVMIVALESLVALAGVDALLSGDFSLIMLPMPAMIAGQVALFLHARKKPPPLTGDELIMLTFRRLPEPSARISGGKRIE
jgi:hypothetical protein